MRPLEIILIILIILFVGGIIAWQVVKHVRKKQGKSTGSSCGCSGCSGCAANGGCPSANAAKYYSDDPDDVMPEINVRSEITCDFSDIVAKMNGETAAEQAAAEDSTTAKTPNADKDRTEVSSEGSVPEKKPMAKKPATKKPASSTSTKKATSTSNAKKSAANKTATSATAKKPATKKSAASKPKNM